MPLIYFLLGVAVGAFAAGIAFGAFVWHSAGETYRRAQHR